MAIIHNEKLSKKKKVTFDSFAPVKKKNLSNSMLVVDLPDYSLVER